MTHISAYSGIPNFDHELLKQITVMSHGLMKRYNKNKDALHFCHQALKPVQHSFKTSTTQLEGQYNSFKASTTQLEGQ